jgi:HPt (histidine-containing phosphotransfer) domain-containing protein
LTIDRADTIRFYLHALHGAAGMFGFARLSALVQKLHRKCDSLTPDAYRVALDEIAAVLSASLAALAALGWQPPLD